MGGAKRQLDETWEPQWHTCGYFGCRVRGTEGVMKLLTCGFVEKWYCPKCWVKYNDECMAEALAGPNDG